MREFRSYHPIVNFMYFLSVIVLSAAINNPFCYIISLLTGFLYLYLLSGSKAVKSNFLLILPIFILTVIINPIVSNEGETVLFYIFKPITLEALLFGVAQGLLLSAIITHFSYFNSIITSDKLMFLLGKISSTLSLMISMIFNLVPQFKMDIKSIDTARRCIGKNKSSANEYITNFSILISKSLEKGIETADSMKARGFGEKKRTSYSVFRFYKRDIFAFLSFLILFVLIIIFKASGIFFISYYPNLMFGEFTITAYIAYTLLLLIPLIIEATEVIRWKNT